MMRSFLLKTFCSCLLVICCFSTASYGAYLTYTFDDGHISVYTRAFQILSRYGQVGSANVISSTVASADDNQDLVNARQLLLMQGAGWEICSHSKTHPRFGNIPQTYNDEVLDGWQKASGLLHTYVANYPYKQLPFLMEDGNALLKKKMLSEVDCCPGTCFFDDSNGTLYVHTTTGDAPWLHEIRSDSVQRELEMSKLELQAMGLTVNGFAVPFSDWNEERALLASQYYYSVVAGSRNGHNVNEQSSIDPYWLVRKEVTAETCLEVVKGWIEAAIESDSWLILMFHHIGDENSGYYYTWPESDFEALAAFVATKDISVVTQQEGLRQLGCCVPIAPSLDVSTNGTTVSLSWKNIASATGYNLFYAPYPDADYVGKIDLGNLTTISAEFPDGAAFYVALQAYNELGESGFSDIEFFVVHDERVRNVE